MLDIRSSTGVPSRRYESGVVRQGAGRSLEWICLIRGMAAIISAMADQRYAYRGWETGQNRSSNNFLFHDCLTYFQESQLAMFDRSIVRLFGLWTKVSSLNRQIAWRLSPVCVAAAQDRHSADSRSQTGPHVCWLLPRRSPYAVRVFRNYYAGVRSPAERIQHLVFAAAPPCSREWIMAAVCTGPTIRNQRLQSGSCTGPSTAPS